MLSNTVARRAHTFQELSNSDSLEAVSSRSKVSLSRVSGQAKERSSYISLLHI